MFDPSYDHHYAKNFYNWTVSWAGRIAKLMKKGNTYQIQIHIYYLVYFGEIYHIFSINTIRTRDSIYPKPGRHFSVLKIFICMNACISVKMPILHVFPHAKETKTWGKKNANRNWNIFVKWQLSRYAFFSIIDATLSNHIHHNWSGHGIDNVHKICFTPAYQARCGRMGRNREC